MSVAGSATNGTSRICYTSIIQGNSQWRYLSLSVKTKEWVKYDMFVIISVVTGLPEDYALLHYQILYNNLLARSFRTFLVPFFQNISLNLIDYLDLGCLGHPCSSASLFLVKHGVWFGLLLPFTRECLSNDLSRAQFL